MVILKFTSPTCGPCIQLNSWLEAQDQNSLPTIVSVNVAKAPKLAKQFGVFQVPCSLLAIEETNEEGKSTFKEVKPSAERVFGFKVPELLTLFAEAKNG